MSLKRLFPYSQRLDYQVHLRPFSATRHLLNSPPLYTPPESSQISAKKIVEETKTFRIGAGVSLSSLGTYSCTWCLIILVWVPTVRLKRFVLVVGGGFVIMLLINLPILSYIWHSYAPNLLQQISKPTNNAPIAIPIWR